MSAQRKDRHGITAVAGECQSVASPFEEMLWWQTLAINQLHAVGLVMSDVAGHDAASMSRAREHSRTMLCQVIDDVEHALHLVDAGARTESLSKARLARVER